VSALGLVWLLLARALNKAGWLERAAAKAPPGSVERLIDLAPPLLPGAKCELFDQSSIALKIL
jgi:hypothetical protein